MCLSWVRKALVCAIDRPSQLQSKLPSRDQQEKQQAAGLDLFLHGSSPDGLVDILHGVLQESEHFTVFWMS